MELIEWILQDENINKAINSVKKNKGASLLYASASSRVIL